MSPFLLQYGLQYGYIYFVIDYLAKYKSSIYNYYALYKIYIYVG
jgi:hypothetical protein